MGAFNFKNKLTLDIEGNKFIIDTSSTKIVEAHQKLVNESLALVQTSNETEKNELDNFSDNVKELIKVSSEYIKAVIGEDGFDIVFKDKILDYSDLSDLAIYICNEITTFKQDRMAKYYSQRMN